jgi:hypothetical protein
VGVRVSFCYEKLNKEIKMGTYLFSKRNSVLFQKNEVRD